MSSLYKTAIIEKYRFAASQGLVTVEDLYSLPLETLDTIARNLKKTMDEAQEETLFETDRVDIHTKNKYDLVVDVFKTKQQQAKDAQEARKKAQQRARIRELIAQKEEGALAESSIDELKAMLADD